MTKYLIKESLSLNNRLSFYTEVSLFGLSFEVNYVSRSTMYRNITVYNLGTLIVKSKLNDVGKMQQIINKSFFTI